MAMKNGIRIKLNKIKWNKILLNTLFYEPTLFLFISSYF